MVGLKWYGQMARDKGYGHKAQGTRHKASLENMHEKYLTHFSGVMLSWYWEYGMDLRG